jgi:hypothetical protein
MSYASCNKYILDHTRCNNDAFAILFIHRTVCASESIQGLAQYAHRSNPYRVESLQYVMNAAIKAMVNDMSKQMNHIAMTLSHLLT